MSLYYKPVAADDQTPPKAVILSPAAQLFLQKYAFQNNYRNDNAITICMSGDFFALNGGCNDLWMGRLKVMIEVCKVFLLVRAESEEALAAFRARLAQSSMAPLVPPHRVLAFCTEVGKVAVVRQIQPGIHIEDEAAVCPKLCPHVPTLLHLRSEGEARPYAAAAGKWSEIKQLSDIVMS